MAKKKCELCQLPASLYCESDQASLCARCDSKVHEANFLVARHSRTLLCRTCQSPTPWKASGARLGNTVTECDKCAELQKEESEGGDVDDDVFTDDEVFTDGSECDEDEAEEEGENQVVPLPRLSSPPAASSSSSSSVCASRTMKRVREWDSDRRPQPQPQPQPQNDVVASSSCNGSSSFKSRRAAEDSKRRVTNTLSFRSSR